MQDIQVEIGKLMAHVESFQKQLSDIKKDVIATKKEIRDVHAELNRFVACVQTRDVCQQMREKMDKQFIQRAEFAPVKNVANIIVLTTATTICVALLGLILK